MLHGHHVRWEVTWASISGIPGTMVNNSGTQKLSTFTILSMIVQRSVTKSTHTPNHQILWSWMDARHGCSPVWCPEFMHLTLPYKDITEAQQVCQSMCLLGLIVFPLLVQGFLSFFFFFLFLSWFHSEPSHHVTLQPSRMAGSTSLHVDFFVAIFFSCSLETHLTSLSYHQMNAFNEDSLHPQWLWQ